MAADEGKSIKVRVSFSDDAGNEESLTSAATAANAAAPEPLTASFSGVPAEHGGAGKTFTFRLQFSEVFDLSYKVLRDEAFDVTGGKVRQARRVDGRDDLREIHVEPTSSGTVSIRLPETSDCSASGAICTGDGRPLSHSSSATVAGPAGPRCPRPPSLRSTEATGSCRSGASTRTDRDFLLLAAPCGVGQRLADVVALKIRIGGQHLVGVVAGGQQSHDGSNRHAKPSNARAAAHDVRILCDAVQSDHGSSIGVRWPRVTGGGARNPALAALRGCPSIASTCSRSDEARLGTAGRC